MRATDHVSTSVRHLPSEREIHLQGGWSELSQTCIRGMKLTDMWELNPEHCWFHWESKMITPAEIMNLKCIKYPWKF